MISSRFITWFVKIFYFILHQNFDIFIAIFLCRYNSFSHLLPFLLKITPTIYIPFERGDLKEYFKIKNLILNCFSFFDLPAPLKERQKQVNNDFSIAVNKSHRNLVKINTFAAKPVLQKKWQKSHDPPLWYFTFEGAQGIPYEKFPPPTP